jgi:predicted adenylyl cyclase CyaB
MFDTMLAPKSTPDSQRPRQNIEIKARLESLSQARQVAVRIATEHVGVAQQTDTFFHTPTGRLKVRQADGRPAELIAYDRPDTREAKASSYFLVPVDDADGLLAGLASTLGIRCVVRKRREIFLFHNVRIHLDQVEALGEFLELESVLGPDVDETKARQRLDEVLAQFQIPLENQIDVAYADMLERPN